MESLGGGFRVCQRGHTVHHSAQALSPLNNNLKTQQTLTRDRLGGHLPDMSPPKEDEIWRLPGPVQALSKSTIEHDK